jgi:hypothetical protein
MGELSCPFGAEIVEEGVQGGVVAARSSPHQAPAVVVDDDNQVAVAPLVGDLIDPDATEAVEAVDLGVDVGADAGHDGADGAPCHPQQLHDGALGGADGQPGGLVIEVTGVPRIVAGPGHSSDGRPVRATADPGSLGLQVDAGGTQVECSPPAPSLASVITR